MSHVPGFAPDHVLVGMSEEVDLRTAVARAQIEDWTRFLALSGPLRTFFASKQGQRIPSCDHYRARTSSWQLKTGETLRRLLATEPAAMARTPVLPEAPFVWPLSAHLGRSRSTALDPEGSFNSSSMYWR
jgi:hypothetical protein